ncbi:MAG: hypothetical protein FWH48_06980 [Oscillospiraceae bacterium]|nr:hypothetical protein [Oscillospiraceae bacterium]
MNIRHIIRNAISALFIAILLFFYIFGAQIRDLYSPHVTAVRLASITPDGSYLQSSIPEEILFDTDVFIEEQDQYYVFTILQDDSSGEMCAYAVKTPVQIGMTVDNYVELKGLLYGVSVVFFTDRRLEDGIRIVLN